MDELSKPRNRDDASDAGSSCFSQRVLKSSSDAGSSCLSQRLLKTPASDVAYVKPVFEGGMRHDDDALDALLRKARGCVQSGRLPMYSCHSAQDAESDQNQVETSRVPPGETAFFDSPLRKQQHLLTAVNEEEAVSDHPGSGARNFDGSEGNCEDDGSPSEELFAPQWLPYDQVSSSGESDKLRRRPILRRIRTPTNGSPIFVPASQLRPELVQAKSMRLVKLYARGIQ
jgi:hypothetical protein